MTDLYALRCGHCGAPFTEIPDQTASGIKCRHCGGVSIPTVRLPVSSNNYPAYRGPNDVQSVATYLRMWALDDLHLLARAIGVDPDNIGGGTKSTWAMNLAHYVDRRGVEPYKLEKLYCAIGWPTVDTQPEIIPMVDNPAPQPTYAPASRNTAPSYQIVVEEPAPQPVTLRVSKDRLLALGDRFDLGEICTVCYKVGTTRDDVGGYTRGEVWVLLVEWAARQGKLGQLAQAAISVNPSVAADLA